MAALRVRIDQTENPFPWQFKYILNISKERHIYNPPRYKFHFKNNGYNQILILITARSFKIRF